MSSGVETSREVTCVALRGSSASLGMTIAF
jgi:hypothetical protein